jgi:hypothetical protein
MKGLIFSKELIPAVLDGTKTMTRRIIKPQPYDMLDMAERGVTPRIDVGETVYVKEAWRAEEVDEYDGLDGIRYKADNCFLGIPPKREAAEAWLKVYDGDHPDRWKSPIYLPEWAARAKLEITAVRAERVQDITEEDAVREGIQKEELVYDHESVNPPGAYGFVSGLHPFPEGMIHVKPQEAFEELWESIHGPGSWERNDWCWVYEFRRTQ